jgi:ABC-type uncharacterized transport system auxiliary subunit
MNQSLNYTRRSQAMSEIAAHPREAFRLSETIALALLLLAAGMSFGCGAARPSTYYQLTVPTTVPQPGESAPYHISLVVAPLMTTQLYRQDRIVYNTGAQAMGLYEYHRWAAPPAQMMVGVLVRMLRASGLYETVSVLRSNLSGDFMLRGNLYDFKEISNPALSTRVTFDLDLRDMKSGSTVWTHFYTHDEPVNGKDVASVVASLDHNFQMGVTESTNSLNSYFSVHRPQ